MQKNMLRFRTGCGKCKEFIQYLVRDILEECNVWKES